MVVASCWAVWTLDLDWDHRRCYQVHIMIRASFVPVGDERFLSEVLTRAAGLPELLFSGYSGDRVILLDADLADSGDLAVILQSMGVDVLHGSHAGRMTECPVIMISAKNRRRPEVMLRMKFARLVYPHAPICLVVGLLPQWVAPPAAQIDLFDDARDILLAAGVCFISEIKG